MGMTMTIQPDETKTQAEIMKAETDDQNLLLSKAIKQSVSGKLSVDIVALSKTKKFQEDLEILKEIEKEYRAKHGRVA
jgi:hypothetical protein